MKKNKLKNKIETIIIAVEAIILLILGGLTIKYNYDIGSLFLFGLLFFFAGLFVSTQAKYFGLIFLFSHGGTGMGLMLGSIFFSDSASYILSDISVDKRNLLIVAGVFVIMTFISAVFYNLNDDVKKIPFTKAALLTFPTIAMLIITYVFGIIL